MKGTTKKQIYFNQLHYHPKWKQQIEPRLQALRNKQLDGLGIIAMLKTFNSKYCWRRSQYYQQKQKQWNFRALQIEYLKELPQICQGIAHFLLTYKPQSILMMMGQQKQARNYNKKQLFYILSLMFLCLTPKQYSDKNQHLQNKFHNINNFSYILSRNSFKTACIVEYFKNTIGQIFNPKIGNQLFCIIRNVENKSVAQIIKIKGSRKLHSITIQENHVSIEEFVGQIKIDFANRFIGGGCLRNGCVQEQIMFAVRPQLYATTLLCQQMQDNQSLALIGFQKYFKSKGYASSTSFDGYQNIDYKLNQIGIVKEYIVAIDALKYKQKDKYQFYKQAIDRQLKKAYVGFWALQQDLAVVSGGWGCGVYNGDFQTKLLIQWIAASLAEKELVICPFGRKHIVNNDELFKILGGKTIKQVYDLLIEGCNTKIQFDFKKEDIYDIILLLCRKDQSHL